MSIKHMESSLRVKIVPIILVLIALIATVGIAAMILLHPSLETTSGETPTTTTGSQELGGSTTPSKTATAGGVNIEGAWYGTYTSDRFGGTGRWACRIKKMGDKYIGVLTLTGPYQASSMLVQITLEGNKITLGWAGGATFTGTVSGDNMQGTWEAPGGSDHGPWNGVRGETDITPEWPETLTSATTSTLPSTIPTSGTTTTSAATTTTPTTTVTTTTPSFPNDLVSMVYSDVMDTLQQIHDDVSFYGYYQMGEQYYLVYIIPQNITNPSSEDQQILDQMVSKGYQLVNHMTTAEGFMIILSTLYNGEEYIVSITGSTGSNEIVVIVYPPTTT